MKVGDKIYLKTNLIHENKIGSDLREFLANYNYKWTIDWWKEDNCDFGARCSEFMDGEKLQLTKDYYHIKPANYVIEIPDEVFE